MPYVERTVIAGRIRETRKMHTGRVHTKGAVRTHRGEGTSVNQRDANRRRAEENLRWILNANFSAGDIHLVLHYYDKNRELCQSEKDRSEFLRKLRQKVKAIDIEWKYVACTETKRMTNIHHHIILPSIEVNTLFEVWEEVLGVGVGNVSIKPLDKRGNHAKLATYLMKETESTCRRYRQLGKRYKRFSTAQGMEHPQPEYRVVSAKTWSDMPRARKGYILLKDDNGEVTRAGISEVSGYPWQEYFELWVGADPPGKR